MNCAGTEHQPLFQFFVEVFYSDLVLIFDNIQRDDKRPLLEIIFVEQYEQ